MSAPDHSGAREPCGPLHGAGDQGRGEAAPVGCVAAQAQRGSGSLDRRRRWSMIPANTRNDAGRRETTVRTCTRGLSPTPSRHRSPRRDTQRAGASVPAVFQEQYLIAAERRLPSALVTIVSESTRLGRIRPELWCSHDALALTVSHHRMSILSATVGAAFWLRRTRSSSSRATLRCGGDGLTLSLLRRHRGRIQTPRARAVRRDRQCGYSNKAL